MLRGLLHASVPPLEHFPGQEGPNRHLCPAPSTSLVMTETDGGLSTCAASTTFWRSPYSEALRQSRSSLSKASDSASPRREPVPSLVRKDQEKTTRDELKSILKNGSERKDSGSDTSTDVRQVPGILCKSSVSSSTRCSGGKVQKRVKFHDSAAREQCCHHVQSASCGGAVSRRDHQPLHHRAMSASMSARPSLPRMPCLRCGGDQQQKTEKHSLSHSCCPRSPHHQIGHSSENHPLRPQSGPLVPSSSVSHLPLSRSASRNETQYFCHLVHSPRHNRSTQPRTANNSSACPNPPPLEFKIYRQSPVFRPGSSPRVRQPNLAVPADQSRAIFLSDCAPDHATRNRVCLSGSFPCLSNTVMRPVKRDDDWSSDGRSTVKRPTPPSLQNNLSLGLSFRRTEVHSGTPHTRLTAQHKFVQIGGDVDDEEENDERRERFLHDDKTVQILNWLKEVNDKQAREGRCQRYPPRGDKRCFRSPLVTFFPIRIKDHTVCAEVRKK